MNSLVGFTIYRDVSQKKITAINDAHERVLSQFGHFERRSLNVGETYLDVWGRGNAIDERIHALPDGSLAVLIGSPHQKINWENVQDISLASDYELPWDGRVVLLHINPDGSRWTMWNDWMGSIPVYYADIESGRIASTLEPVTVAAAGYTPDEFFMPGLVSLMLNGHLISDWTLYQGMKTIPSDSVAAWDESGCRVKKVWSVKPSSSRWEAGWDNLVDEMHEVSRKAIADVLKTQSTWTLPLSSGLDSRLIAGVAADVGADVNTYAYGSAGMTDVVYSKQIAKTLGFPWKHIELPKDFLVKYTRRWADWYGSSLHFHGMYQMAFLDGIEDEPRGPILSGFIGETIAGDGLSEHTKFHLTHPEMYQVGRKWFVFWTPEELKSVLKVSIEEAIEANAVEIQKLVDIVPGTIFQKIQFLRLGGRQRFFTSYQAALSDYWRGVATPFMDRAYARFCLSLPLAALDNRRLLADVFRRYYGRLAVIPGTYAKDPFILTGRYLMLRRIANFLPSTFHWGPLKGFNDIPPRMDVDSIRDGCRDSLWPLFEDQSQLSNWMDVSQLEKDYQTLLRSKKDILPLRRLQSAQAMAFRLQ